MSRTHIEVTQRYAIDLSESEKDHFDELNLPYPEPVYKYRRRLVHVDDIFSPAEWEGKKNHLRLEFYSGEMWSVQYPGGYQAFALFWQDLWAERIGDLEIEEVDEE